MARKSDIAPGIFGAKVAMTSEVLRCQVAVNHAGDTKQRNTKTLKVSPPLFLP